MDIYINLTEEQLEKVKNLDSAVGMNAWNIAIMLAPYDTGNLRNSIKLVTNTSKKITIGYDLMKANYIKFLELGLGPVKKHRGFISVKTRLSIVEQLLIYLKTGKPPLFNATPQFTLRSSSSVFWQEKKFLTQAMIDSRMITPGERRSISLIRETNYRKMQGQSLKTMRGKSPSAVINKQQTLLKSRKGVSVLQQMYRESRGK